VCYLDSAWRLYGVQGQAFVRLGRTRQPGEITHPRLLGVAGAGFMQLYAGEHRIPRL